MRRQSVCAFALAAVFIIVFTFKFPDLWWTNIPVVILLTIGIRDLLQSRHAIKRNFPIIGHFRYLLESIRPEINQYFVESDTNGTPFSRETRAVVYQRAKNQRDTVAFGTRHDLYQPGREWVRHSMMPTKVASESLRVTVGGPLCTHPFDTSIFAISAMSFGALSSRAVEALNKGAKMGSFMHNSGEGGISQYHLTHGGDLVWQIGTGYFGCRNDEGGFDAELFKEVANLANIKMIEIKLSQGAKPGKGGLLPGAKITKEIAAARRIPMGKDAASPARHTAFSDHLGLLDFIERLRTLSGGKPVGIKLCVGIPEEFITLCQDMHDTGLLPDFIAVDGAEGGTGAAPLEFSNHVGMPLTDALAFVNRTLIDFDLRKHIRIIASGRITDGFDIVRTLALGADIVASARGMMLALGCIQALRCDSNKCPTGIATQDPNLSDGLVVSDKAERVARYHQKTLQAVAEMVGAMGLTHTRELRPEHIARRRPDGSIGSLAEISVQMKEVAKRLGSVRPSV